MREGWTSTSKRKARSSTVQLLFRAVDEQMSLAWPVPADPPLSLRAALPLQTSAHGDAQGARGLLQPLYLAVGNSVQYSSNPVVLELVSVRI